MQMEAEDGQLHPSPHRYEMTRHVSRLTIVSVVPPLESAHVFPSSLREGTDMLGGYPVTNQHALASLCDHGVCGGDGLLRCWPSG